MAYKHLILGGARSGKSSFAEKAVTKLAAMTNATLVYVATAQAGDDEMAQRITRHQQSRDTRWNLIEAPLNLADVLTNATQNECILIDCLTLWLSNCLHHEQWSEQKEAFITSLNNCPASVTLVSNEVGQGIVPMGKLSRDFVDQSGWLHQELAQLCEHVSFIVAGLENKLK